MKMNKKKLLSLSLVIVLIAIMSFGTLAWFSADDEVTNKFMVANSADTPDEVFSVDVWEPSNKDENGDGIVDENDRADVGNEYKNILPGSELDKKPTIENTGSYHQYVRVKVTVNNADAWIAAINNRLGGTAAFDLSDIFKGHDESVWTRYDAGEYNSAENTYTMVFYLNNTLAPDETVCLFDTVVIPSKLTQADMTFIGGEFTLKILAEAVQTENLGEGVDTAYEAFAVVEADQPISENP